MVLEADYFKLLSNQILNLFNMRSEIEKNKKRAFRALWIARINAGARELGVSYSVLINSLAKKDIALDRKILSDIAISDNATFEKIVKIATS
jgi:large subunit ribosomal protein L20